MSTERELFEAEVRAVSKTRAFHFDLERIEADPDDTPEEAERVGEYAYYDTQAAWLLWQAARSGQAASGSHKEARSDDPERMDGANLDQQLAYWVPQAQTAVAELGQPEAPTAAPREWVDSIMEQAQVFASAWSLVGGKFDDGTFHDAAIAEKQALRQMLAHPPARSVAAPLGRKLVPTDPPNAMLLPIVRAFKCGHAEAWKALSEAIDAAPPARSGAGSEEGRG